MFHAFGASDTVPPRAGATCPANLSAVVVDTSALVAVLFAEPERESLIAVLAEADDPLISAATSVGRRPSRRPRRGTRGR
jgi:hypothetical protein